MNKASIRTIVCVAACAAVTSCFKDEPLNAECDIQQAYIHTDNPLDLFFLPSDTLVNVPSDKDDVIFNIKADADITNLAPMFRLTEGATISPENGSIHDFSNGKSVTYTVTSQDGNWQRTYRVAFRTYDPVSDFDFEHYRLVNGANGGSYYVWSDILPDGSEAGNWATGNSGFNLSMSSAKPEEYPTSPVKDGQSGAAVKLETKDTGPLGHLVGKGLAAGNLFIGSFDATSALTDAMKATRFGLPFDRKPTRLMGWYKYRPGSNFVDEKNKPVSGKKDRGDIYAVLYRNYDNNGNAIVLHGDDVKTHPNIVAMAQLDEVKTTDEWTSFSVDFVYKAQLDPQILKNRGYNLAVVFTSSEEGASFRGAIGSTLYIDNVKVEWDENF